MAKLSDEDQAALDALLAKRDADDSDDDYEIEIEDNGKRARVPYSKGRSWLQKNFGIDLDPEPEPADDEPADGKGKVTSAKRFAAGRRVG